MSEDAADGAGGKEYRVVFDAKHEHHKCMDARMGLSSLVLDCCYVLERVRR